MSDQLAAILKHSLKDFRVSRSEKRVLKNILEQLGADEHDLAVIRHQAFEIARQELVGPDAIKVTEWLEDIVKALQPSELKDAPESEAYFSPGEECLRRIVSLFQRARQTADVCVFTITDDRISQAIREAHERRLKIRIITDNDKANDIGSDVYRLGQLGIPLVVDRTSNHMHHKFGIFDSKILLTGSYNWTRSAASHNEENILVSYERPLVRKFQSEFDKLWDHLND